MITSPSLAISRLEGEPDASFITVTGRQIHWIQPKALARWFELRAEDDLLGSLRFETAFGTLATAQAAGASWTFKRVGFLNPRVTVREAGAELDLDIYRSKFWGDGCPVSPDGRVFHSDGHPAARQVISAGMGVHRRET